MARDGTGLYAFPAGYPFVYGTLIDQAIVNSLLADVGNELTNSLDKGGRTTPTANLPMGGFKLTGLAAGSVAGESARYEQVMNNDATSLVSAATTNLAGQLQSNITITGSTAITSFGTGAAAGVRKFVTFTGTPLITHSATLICPGAANFTPAAGGTMEVISEGSNVWRVCWPQTGQLVKLSELGNASAAHSLTAGKWQQTWAWQFDAPSQIGLLLTGETTSGSNQIVTRWSYSTGFDGDYIQVYLQSKGAPTVGFNVGQGNWTWTLPGSVAANGKSFALYGGATEGVAHGGSVALYGGISTGATYGSGFRGGDLTLAAGAGSGASGVGGLASLAAGDGTYQGGDLTIRPGTGSTLPGTLRLQNGANTVALAIGGKVPTISSGGGAGAAIRGCDNFFEITFGTGSPTNVVVGFSASKGAAPMAVVSGSQAGQVLTYATTTAGVTISSGTAFTAGTKVSCYVVEAG